MNLVIFIIYLIIYCSFGAQTHSFSVYCNLSSTICLSYQSRSQILSDAKYIASKLNLVDLAGSERLGKTGVSLRASL